MENYVLNDYDAPNLDGQTCNCGLFRGTAVSTSSLLLFFSLQILVCNFLGIFFL